MEKVATDIYSFPEPRNEGFTYVTYVGKTREIHAMASGDVGVQFFMARPRRFGKSLAVIAATRVLSAPANSGIVECCGGKKTCGYCPEEGEE